MEEFSMILSNSTKLLRFFFLYTFVNWVRVHIEDHTLSMIDFIKWLVFLVRERHFFVSLLPSFFLACLYILCVLFLPLLGVSNAKPFIYLSKKENVHPQKNSIPLTRVKLSFTKSRNCNRKNSDSFSCSIKNY